MDRTKFPGAIKYLLVIGCVFWVVFVVASYYVVHTPEVFENSTHFFGAWLDIIIVVSLVGLSGGIGRRILPSSDRINRLEWISVCAAFGLGLSGFFVLAIGLAGILKPWLLWLLLVLGIVFFWSDILSWLRDWKELFRVELSKFSWFSAAFVLFISFLGLLQALAPPLKWDSLVYHLEMPRQYLAAGQVIYLENNLFVGFPQLAEMNYTWAMALHSGRTAGLLGWAIGMLALVGVEGLARRLVNPQIAWIAPAVIFSGAHIAQALSWAYVDLWVMLFGVSMLIALTIYFQNKKKLWLLVAALMVGFALSTKYTAGILLPIGSLMLVLNWLNASRRQPNSESKKTIKALLFDLMIFSVIVFVVFSPWLIKNYVFTKNPIYPFLFPGRDLDTLRQSFHKGDLTPRTFLDDLLLPWHATVLSVEGGEIEGIPRYDASIGPLFLALIPLFVVGWNKRNSEKIGILRYFLWLSLAAWVYWASVAHLADSLMRARHYFGVFPIFAVLAVAGYWSISQIKISQVRVGRLIAALMALSYVLTGLTLLIVFVSANPLPLLLGLETEPDYLEDQLGWYAVAMETINGLPSQSKILFLWESRPYYCEATCIPDTILDRWWYYRRTLGEADQISSQLRSENVTHVLIYDLGVQMEKDYQPMIKGSDWHELERFVDEELVLLESFGDGDAYSLYRLSSEG
jgi:hypothetical protein